MSCPCYLAATPLRHPCNIRFIDWQNQFFEIRNVIFLNLELIRSFKRSVNFNDVKPDFMNSCYTNWLSNRGAFAV